MGNHDYEERDNSTFALSDTGWTNDNLGLQWLKEVFEPETWPSGRSHHRLLLIDGHSSHLTLEFLEFAMEHNIHLLCFPPHSTHVLQPLDVGIFGPLGTYYSNQVDCWMRAHPYQAISKGDFYPLCQKARAQALTQPNIQAAFAATGIFPFYRGKVMTLIDKSRVGPLLETKNKHWQLPVPPLPSLPASSQESLPDTEPSNAREVAQLKRKIEVSDNLNEVKALGLALGSAADKSMTATAIAQETVRQISAIPKKSKSDRRQISRAKLLSRKDLDKARRQRLEKEELTRARTKARLARETAASTNPRKRHKNIHPSPPSPSTSGGRPPTNLLQKV